MRDSIKYPWTSGHARILYGNKILQISSFFYHFHIVVCIYFPIQRLTYIYLNSLVLNFGSSLPEGPKLMLVIMVVNIQGFKLSKLHGYVHCYLWYYYRLRTTGYDRLRTEPPLNQHWVNILGFPDTQFLEIFRKGIQL